jgi:hypothetical protein
VTALAWGITFPTVPANLVSGGVAQPFSLAGLAKNENYEVTVEHFLLSCLEDQACDVALALAGPEQVELRFLPRALRLSDGSEIVLPY